MEETGNTPLWKAMLEVQKKLDHAAKDAKNPHLKNKYASLGSVLDTVKPVLNEHGLVLTQHIMGVNQQVAPGFTSVITKITHAESGYSIEDNQMIPMPKSDPQGLGSAITYARRYGIKTMLGINEEDDDGNAASIRPYQKEDDKRNATPSGTSGSAEKANNTGAGDSKPADPAKVQEMKNKLKTTLGFKKE